MDYEITSNIDMEIDDLIDNFTSFSIDDNIFTRILSHDVNELVNMYIQILVNPNIFVFYMEVNPMLEMYMNDEMMNKKLIKFISNNNNSMLKLAIKERYSLVILEEDIINELVNQYYLYLLDYYC